MALLNVFGEIERVLADLYPYSLPLTALLLAGCVALLYQAYRLGAGALLWRHRLLAGATALPLLVAGGVAGDYLLSPLWERSFLEEASPLAAVEAAPEADESVVSAPEPGAAADTPASATVLRRGGFKGADDFHFGRGEAQIIRAPDGSLVVRFEAFSVRNGPDLYVYLSRDASSARVDESLNLGRLKATDGAFNYDVPAGLDTSGIRSVVVWCRQFGVLFARAVLEDT